MMNSLTYLGRAVYTAGMVKEVKNVSGAGALLASAFIYGSYGLLVREMSKMFGNSTQVAVRFALAAVIIALFNVGMRKALRLPRPVLFRAIALGVVTAIILVLFTISINATTIANTVFTIYAGSIVTSFVVGTIFFKEKVSPSKIVAIVVALVGLSMFAYSFAALSVGLIAGLAAGVFEGVSNGIRKTLQGVDRNTVTMYQMAVGTLCTLPIVLLSGEQPVLHVSAGPIIAIVVFSFLMIRLSNLLLYGFQHFDVNVGTVILATELVFVAILGYVVLHEVPAPNELIGGALIFLASVLTIVDVPVLVRKLSGSN
jgi:drug/metabolite transporter (DMT)-like permease